MAEAKRTTITAGRWAMVDLDGAWPDKILVWEGDYEHRYVVGYITKYQAMAYYRHWDNGGVWYTVKDGNYRNRDIRLIGDVDAFYGDEIRD